MDFSGNVKNYNGDGKWSVEAVQKRYGDYCTAFRVEAGRSLSPMEHKEGDVRWIYPIMHEVILGIEENDAGCIALGVDFVEEDASFPFGRKLKTNTARALRRTTLNEAQKARLRERISSMLTSGVIPREMGEYVRLLRTIGVGDQWRRLESEIPRENRYAMRFYKILRASEDL
jgi:hypothetical protein